MKCSAEFGGHAVPSAHGCSAGAAGVVEVDVPVGEAFEDFFKGDAAFESG